MAPQSAPKPTAAGNNASSRKRKDPPSNGIQSKKDNKRPRHDHRAKQRDARVLATQTSSRAFKNGQLDVDNFVKSREYEIRALEAGVSRSKQALTKRAFQQVPKDLRRRTASHNVKRVPKRLQPRAKREMAEDNTPTVTSRTRKPTRHMRLRIETVKKLRMMGAKRRSSKENDADTQVTVRPMADSDTHQVGRGTPVTARTPKVKTAKLAMPPRPKAKFRKRQIDKTWLPTHMYHAKRARMTAPKEALWRFAIPLTPTAKSYRPTHRAANERGAIAWDMSYMSTIGMEGQQRSIESVLKALRFTLAGSENDPWSSKSERWRSGWRVGHGFVSVREAPHEPLAPITVIWSTLAREQLLDGDKDTLKRSRKVLLRIHPSAFVPLWEEVIRLGKVARPQVAVEDLRYELGSIEVTGPSATEALLGALWPSEGSISAAKAGSVTQVWTGLAGLTDTTLLPPNAIMSFDIQDPRLHHPPRTIKLPQTADEQQRLIELTASWPLDSSHDLPRLFERRARQKASAALPSQKAINRRKGAAAPGHYPDPTPDDPHIPVMVYSTSPTRGRGGSWTVLMPWKCVQPVWYSVMYYPLSVGGQPRFGGLDERRQLAFERNEAWFPGDFAGTQAGWNWELEQRKKRKEHWERRPKSKRVNWDTVQVSARKNGEIGVGWACDWERLVDGPAAPPAVNSDNSAEDTTMVDQGATCAMSSKKHSVTPRITFVPAHEAERLLRSTMDVDLPTTLPNPSITVSLSCLTRGTPQTCARIYRLPSSASSSTLRKHWLNLHPRHKPNKTGPKNSLPRLPADAPAHLVQRRLAQSLLEPARAGEDEYPSCPGEEDLIGFVTTGNLNLSEGRGTGIGNLLLNRVLEDVRRDEDDGRLCIIRNAGQSIGRLATWTLA